jgi:hypothetical protein
MALRFDQSSQTIGNQSLLDDNSSHWMWFDTCSVVGPSGRMPLSPYFLEA